MKVSLKDIASKLGVSPAVVSLVLNGKEKEGRINAVTAEKIRALAKELNYTPNRFATGLRKGKSNIIGLIVADISNPFFAKLARYIEDEAERYNYKIIIGSSDENTGKLESLVDIMNTYHVDGFIVVPTEDSQSKLQQLSSEKTPLVLVDRYFAETYSDTVLIDNEATALRATDYLIKKGCKRIALFTYLSEMLHFLDRLHGYRQALENASLNHENDDLFFIRYTNISEDIREGIEKLMKRPDYDGILFTTDTLALTAIRQFRKAGIDPGLQYKIFSFDANDSFDFLNFDIPHFAQPLQEMGKAAVTCLIGQIENGFSERPKKIIL